MDYKKEANLSEIFTMLLFFVFILCALFTVLIGTKTYQNIHDRDQSIYEKYVVLDYVSNKVRQGDKNGAISVVTEGDTDILKITQQAQGKTYVTMVYAYDGKLRELFAQDGLEFDLSDGLEVVDCEGISFKLEDNLLTCTTSGDMSESITLDIRTGEADEK